MIDGEWRSPKCDEQGRLEVVVIGGGGGGGGDASAANQLTQITQLADVIANTTGAAKDVTIGQVVTAITDLGDGATIAEIVQLLTNDATAQADILAKLTEIGVDADASASSLVTLVSQTDQIEPKLDELIRFQSPPRLWKRYVAIPGGGLDLTTVYPGRIPTRIETYGDGNLVVKPLDDTSVPVTVVSNFGWTWSISAATIEDTTTALPLIVYWS
jgi:hypothetical protein